MRKIVDSNYLNKPELMVYLSASRSNFAVLCDYAAIEAYKASSPIKSIAASMEILSKFPKQVIVLKNTVAIQKQKIEGAGSQRRMVDVVGTKGFSSFCDQLKAALSSSEYYANQLREHGVAASLHAKQSLDGAKEIRESVSVMAQDFTVNELARLRTHQRLTDDLVLKIQKQILTIAAHAHESAGIDIRSIQVFNLRHSLTFRYALCAFLMSLRWIENGSSPQNLGKIRNHIFDCGFAAYATYFDGFLTDDKDAYDTYRAALAMLKSLEKLREG